MQTFSFDVFDTCVTRCYIKPTDIFETLFTQLLTNANHPPHHIPSSAKSLAQQRILAERTAHQNLIKNQSAANSTQEPAREEIEMIEIYQLLEPQLASYGLGATQAMNAEIELELSSLSPILSTQRQIKQLRARGHQIGFISDMYLPTTAVRQILETNGFLAPEDFLYVSSDIGYTKGSGKLFRHVCQQLDISPAQLHHTGDNFYADVRAADKVGLKWTYFKQGTPNRYESADRIELLPSEFGTTPGTTSWSASYLVGLSRAIRLQHDQGQPDQGQLNQKHPTSRQQATLSANILAPLLAGYLFSIIHTALQADIQRLYYRDPLGEKLSAIATHIVQKLSHTAPASDFKKVQFLPHSTFTETHLVKDTADTATSSHHNSHSIGTILSASPTNHNLRFSLLPTAQPPTLQPVAPSYSHHTYLSLPISWQNASYKFPGELTTLVTHQAVIETLLRSLTNTQAEFSWQIITQYIEHLATNYPTANCSTTQPHYACTHPTQSIDLLKRYATSNLVQFLSSPSAADVAAFLHLTAADITTQTTQTLIKPIRLHNIPSLIKQIVKPAAPSSDHAGSWVEASTRLSSWPNRQLSNALRQPSRRLYQYILTQRPLWLYKPLMRLHSRRDRHHSETQPQANHT